MSWTKYHEVLKELSGSRTQNRFKYQKYWSLQKVYELFKEQEDFSVIFDLACDLDVVLKNEIHFFQIKTLSEGKFSTSKIISKRGKKRVNNRNAF